MADKTAQYVPLRCRSPYSILEGAIKIGDLGKRAKEYRFPALGLTDTTNMCGALEFSGTISKTGIQPIMGVTLAMDIGLEGQPGRIRRDPDGTLALLAQSDQGYQNLMALSSAAYLEVEATDVPHIKAAKLDGHTEDVIALTGGPDGALNKLICAGQMGEAEAWLDRLAALYPNRLYVELQRHGTGPEIEAEKTLIDWAYTKGLPLVATNEPYFMDPDMHAAHDVLLCISAGTYVLKKDRRKLTKEHYFKSAEQMAELFKDIPEAIENTVDIAKRCAYQSVARDPILPNFGDGSQSEGDILAEQAHEGLKARLAAVEPSASVEAYTERLEFELNVKKWVFRDIFLSSRTLSNGQKSKVYPSGQGVDRARVLLWRGHC